VSSTLSVPTRAALLDTLLTAAAGDEPSNKSGHFDHRITAGKSELHWHFDGRNGWATRSHAVHDRFGGLFDNADRGGDLAEVGRHAILIAESRDRSPQRRDGLFQ